MLCFASVLSTDGKDAVAPIADRWPLVCAASPGKGGREQPHQHTSPPKPSAASQNSGASALLLSGGAKCEEAERDACGLHLMSAPFYGYWDKGSGGKKALESAAPVERGKKRHAMDWNGCGDLI